MTLLTKEDLKHELKIDDPANDEILELLVAAILDVFDAETNRTLESATFTEYHSCEALCSSFTLKNRPVASITTIHDDPDWSYGADALVSSGDYTFDAETGIVYNTGFWNKGRMNIKVVYVAGYAEGALPARMMRIFCQQCAHWFQLHKESRWDLSSVSLAEGAGTLSFKNVERGYLPQFAKLIELESRW